MLNPSDSLFTFTKLLGKQHRNFFNVEAAAVFIRGQTVAYTTPAALCVFRSSTNTACSRANLVTQSNGSMLMQKRKKKGGRGICGLVVNETFRLRTSYFFGVDALTLMEEDGHISGA